MTHDVSRREFVSDASKLAIGAMIVPRHVLGGVGYQAPSDTLNIAIVGFGGMGSSNARGAGADGEHRRHLRCRLCLRRAQGDGAPARPRRHRRSPTGRSCRTSSPRPHDTMIFA